MEVCSGIMRETHRGDDAGVDDRGLRDDLCGEQVPKPV
jgi:hypothetical protein